MVTFCGHVMEGAWLSSTKMVCIHVLELPQSSVALHVRKIVLSCTQPPNTIRSVDVIVAERSQLSVADAVPVFPGNVLAVQSMVTFGGQVMAGAMLSSINIVCTHVPVFPQSSVAIHVREIVLSWGHAPPVKESLNVIVGDASQLSDAVAVPVAAGNVLVLHWMVIF